MIESKYGINTAILPYRCCILQHHDSMIVFFLCTLLYSQTIFLLPGMMKARLEKLTSDSHRSTIPIRIQKEGYVPPLEWASLDFALVASSCVPNA